MTDNIVVLGLPQGQTRHAETGGWGGVEDTKEAKRWKFTELLQAEGLQDGRRGGRERALYRRING